MSELTPTEGARYLFERTTESPLHASYNVRVFTPTETFAGTAELSDDGAVVTITAPADHVEMLQMLGKLTARSAAKKREDGMPPWPARVLRWRGPGRG